ncbi:MAG: ADP-ribosylglycohydrolase family protein [Candidatus Micrarchaeales archaeon]|nr:ADP-ribosylglycohydrolase family protein [Candidatus Micrarchaeales archaeon]
MVDGTVSKDHFRGVLTGLAVGDALGMPVEFKKEGTFEPVCELRGGGAFHLEAGQWTDDTSMALCIAKSLVEKNDFDPIDIMKRFLKWKDEGYMSSTGYCFDSGETTMMALNEFRSTGKPYRQPPPPGSRRTGNGCIMRLGPIPMAFIDSPEKAVELSELSSKLTHAAAVCVDATRYFGGLIAGALNGATKEELLSDHYSPVPGYFKKKPLVPEISRIAAGSFKTNTPKPTFIVTDTLEMVLWGFNNTTSFRDGMLKVVNRGGDADSYGAVYGQLAGAFYGEKAIPESWRGGIAHWELISGTAEELWEIHLRK